MAVLGPAVEAPGNVAQTIRAVAPSHHLAIRGGMQSATESDVERREVPFQGLKVLLLEASAKIEIDLGHE